MVLNVPANSSLSLVNATIEDPSTYLPDGYSGLTYWNGGGGGSEDWESIFSGDTTETLDGSSLWEMQLYCGDQNYCAATSATPASIGVGGLNFTVEEADSPNLNTPTGLWDQSSGYVWNASGDDWNVGLSATDPSGVCNLTLNVGVAGGASQPESDQFTPQNFAAFQQCNSPGSYAAPVDTSKFVPAGTSGMMTLTADATDAAGNTSEAASSDIYVDNVTPTVSITQLNDANPTGAGDNADAQLQVMPSVGPSGVSSVNCTVDGQPATVTPSVDGSDALDVPDSTTHQVVCTVANNAVNPQGQHNVSAPADFTVKAYDVSSVSFKKIKDALKKKTIKERVRVGYHYVTKTVKGKKVRVKVGGHYVTKQVTRYVEHCTAKHVKVKGKTRKERTCSKPSTSYPDTLTVGHGKATTIYGELVNAQGAGLADQNISVVGTPDNGSTVTTPIATATTDAAGGWSATIPAGPSETLVADYGGDGTQLPSSAVATTTVPARIDVRVNTTALPWSGVLVISGRLAGGYVPADGVAMRLLFKLPGRKEPYAPVPFRTTSTGTFRIKWSWGSGHGVATYPVSVAMTADESDYPFKASTSRAIPVKFGVATPTRRRR